MNTLTPILKVELHVYYLIHIGLWVNRVPKAWSWNEGEFVQLSSCRSIFQFSPRYISPSLSPSAFVRKLVTNLHASEGSYYLIIVPILDQSFIKNVDHAFSNSTPWSWFLDREIILKAWSPDTPWSLFRNGTRLANCLLLISAALP